MLFAKDDWVWLQNRRRRKGESPKLSPKFVGPYRVIEAWANHTYKIAHAGQTSVQNECRLKWYNAGTATPGQTPLTTELPRRPNMRRAPKEELRMEAPPEPEPGLTLPELSARSSPVRTDRPMPPLPRLTSPSGSSQPLQLQSQKG